LTGSLGLINPTENLGRHSLPPLNRFDNKIRATLSNKIRVTRWKTYSLIFLGSENSDREKDTWCSPHCLNAVHEEAGDEYVHGRLKEDKLR
jgi:hypothetical protein